MARFRVDSDVLQIKATEIRNIRMEHESIVSKLDTIISALGDVWEGQSYQRFSNDFNNIRPILSQLSETLDNVSSELEKYAHAYAEIEAKTSSMF